MKNKLKELVPLILILFTCLIIAIILINKPKKEEESSNYDTSFLNNIKVSEAIKEFKSSDTKIYIIGRSTCSISQKFLPILKEVVNEYKPKIYYMIIFGKNKVKNEKRRNRSHLFLRYICRFHPFFL